MPGRKTQTGIAWGGAGNFFWSKLVELGRNGAGGFSSSDPSNFFLVQLAQVDALGTVETFLFSRVVPYQRPERRGRRKKIV